MTDNGDQAALNGLVDDCYPDGWPWEVGDWANVRGKGVRLVVGFGDAPLLGKVLRLNTDPCFPQDVAAIGKCRLYADTWVEGRLREILGDRFIKLEFGASNWQLSIFIEPDDEVAIIRRVYGPTPIQVLAAALREVLKQKEVSGG